MIALSILSTAQCISQSWNASSGLLYVSPSTTKVGIGTTIIEPSSLTIKRQSASGEDFVPFHFLRMQMQLGSSPDKNWDIVANSNYQYGTNTYMLNVNGYMRAKEIKCYPTWADFVFDPEYKLMPLHEVKKYTQEYRHLPNVPSEKEVAQNGINVAQMNAILLQKIEEAYLYIFELEQRIKFLEKSINH